MDKLYRGDHPFTVEFRFQHESGEDIWVAGSAVPFTSSPGEPRSFLGTITDISEIKRIESRIEESRNEALEANNAKSEFLSRMSHELRTPMNAILGFGQLLQMNHPDMPADQRESVNQILSGGEHLLELIEDILDFSRMESGHITLRIGRVKTRRVMQRSLALLTPLAAQVGVKVVLKDEETPDVIADPHRLQQVLVNLLSNAIKYNSRGGRVDIHAEPNAGNKLRIHVIDTGEGIHENDRIRLFKPFERISKSNPMVEGTGIGLSLSKELVELMGGSIDFSSEPGRGTDFWIDVPAASDGHKLPEQAESPVPQPGSPPPKGLKILYIEDHLASIELMMEVAREFEECEFHTATNAPDGIALAKVTPPDLILMDINLPGMDGIEALRLLKSDHRTRDIPVIALSASALSEVVEDGMEAGFSRFLVKPLKLERLFEAIISETSSRNPPKKTGPR
jgi:signal transduction histidine kinase/CheY-like chemotaxis protein